MKYWILILTPTFFLITAPDIHAHKLVTAYGDAQDHQHVYRRQQYGKPLQQGHLYQSPGGSSMVLWGSSNQSDYGKLNGGRDGPIINDQQPKPGGVQNSSKKFGSAVKGYGKPQRDYGSR